MDGSALTSVCRFQGSPGYEACYRYEAAFAIVRYEAVTVLALRG
jgi:hypothetical protein